MCSNSKFESQVCLSTDVITTPNRLCRICLDQKTTQAPLLFACSCNQGVHQSCLIYWMLHTKKYHPETVEQKMDTLWKVKCPNCETLIFFDFIKETRCTNQISSFVLMKLVPLFFLLSIMMIILYFCVKNNEGLEILLPLLILIGLSFLGGTVYLVVKIKNFLNDINDQNVKGINIISLNQ